MKEAIIISANERIPAQWTDDFVKEIDREDFRVKKIVAEDLGVMAAMEWTIPTMVVTYLLKPFFESFLCEAGKDIYAHTKKQLKLFIAKNRAIKIKLMAATQSVNKLSKTYNQSLSISIKARIHQDLTVTVLFDEQVSEKEAPQMMEGMFQHLEFLYDQCQREKPESANSSKKLSGNNLYLVADNTNKRWDLLTERQMIDKYRNLETEDNAAATNEIKSEKKASEKIEMAEVFISYSWDNPEHEQRVVDLTNHLRRKGFVATIDKMISQEKTAVNFVRMMHQALLEHPKVIVILSEGYKKKAETFTGGVGEEYEILINDIKKNERKYILASFAGRGDDIVPIGLSGRDIIDLSKPGEEERLFEKLLDHQRYQFEPVGDQKPALTTIAPQPFVTNPVPIAILHPKVSQTGNSGYIGEQYQDVELLMDFGFKNISSKPLTEFAGEIRLNSAIAKNPRDHRMDGDSIILDVSIQRKIFPNQEVFAHQLKFELNQRNIHRVIDSEISITVFTDEGNVQEHFIFKDLVALKIPGKLWMDAQPLTRDMFLN